MPPEYFYQAFELQRSKLRGVGTQLSNVTQTNLTVLDDARLELLRTGFDSCGVSLDIAGSLRVNKAGECWQGRALANLERARAAGVNLGGVTVLTRATASTCGASFSSIRSVTWRFACCRSMPAISARGSGSRSARPTR